MPYPGWKPTPGCIANAQKMGGRVCDDPNTHCYDSQDYTHKVCQCIDPYLGGCTSSPPPKPDGCCHYTADSPIPSYDNKGMCYCCCSCFAYDTPIAYDQKADGFLFKPVQDFTVDGKSNVLVADRDLTWKLAPLRYSSGAPAKQSALVKLDYKVGETATSLLVTRDQLFLTPDTRLIRADRLKPGDMFVLATGGTTPLLKIAAGIFNKGIQHIATTVAPARSMDGHLLNANGVVAGDYALQIAGFDAEPDHPLMVEGHNDLPAFGTAEYHAAVSGTDSDGTASHLEAGEAAGHVAPDGYTAMQESVALMPEGTQNYVTAEQAWDLQKSPNRAPPGSQVGANIGIYLEKLFGGMYPDIHFEFDQTNDVPNAYAFEIYDQRFVVFTSGLVRMDAIRMEGLAVVIAHCIASLQKLKPGNDAGYSCRGAADYAVASVLSYVFLGKLYADMIEPGIQQITELFKEVSPEHASGDGNTCMGLSLDCRVQAMIAAMTGRPLPQCAGGPPDATLELSSATAEEGEGGAVSVTLTFNQALDPVYAELPASYEFSPLLDVTQATMDPADSKKVIVYPADMEKGVLYHLHVIGLKSVNGNPLNLSKSRAEVTLA